MQHYKAAISPGRILLVAGIICLWMIQPLRVLGNDPGSVIQLAEHEFDLGNYQLVIKTLQTAVSQNTASAETYYWLARSYYEIRDFGNSASQAEKAGGVGGKKSVFF